MTIEAALAANTAAIETQTAALQALQALLARIGVPPPLVARAAPPKPQAAPARAAPVATPEEPTPAEAGSAPTVDEPIEPIPTADAAELEYDDLTYDDVKRAILGVSSAKGRDAAIALLAEFGAAKGPDLHATPEKYAAFCARAQEMLA